MKSEFLYPVRFLLGVICEKSESLTNDQRLSIGKVGRSILQVALSQTPRDDSLVRSGIEAVCRTFASDQSASEALIRQLLPREHLEKHGYKDLPIVAREVHRVIAVSPTLVRDVYITAVTFDEERDEATTMGSSRILGLTSNRRQDYNMSHHSLGEAFPAFLKSAPEIAVEALVGVLSARESASQSADPEDDPTFDFSGTPARSQSDWSYIWDQREYRHELHLKMLDNLESELDHRAASDELESSYKTLLSCVIRHNRWAAVWRQVLASGIRNSKRVANHLAPLACALPILKSEDTSPLAGEFIKVAFSEFDVITREKCERTILSIPASGDETERETNEFTRNRLLACIPSELILTEDAKSLRAELAERNQLPSNSVSSGVSVSSREFTEREYLERRGVATEAPENQELQLLTAGPKAFASKHANSCPSLAEVNTLLGELRALEDALETASASGAHELQILNSLTHLVSAATRAAACEELDCSTDAGGYLKAILLKGAKSPNPSASEVSEGFDNHACWSPAPRIDAAEGLLFLARKPTCIDSALIEEIKRLSVDDVPSVRLQIANHLGLLSKTASQAKESILAHILTRDTSSSVVFAALSRPLWSLMPNSEFLAQLTESVFQRSDLRGEQAGEIRLYCVGIFLNLFLWENHARSASLIQDFCANSALHTGEVAKIVSELREVLVTGSAENPNPKADRARGRAFGLLESIVQSGQQSLATLESRNNATPFAEWPPDDTAKVKALHRIFDSIASQLYFASGASRANGERALPLAAKKQFLKEAGPILDLLGTQGHPSIVHHLIETLQDYLDVAPKEVFLRIASIVKAGKAGGYQYESLAIGEIVRVVNRVFADHRPIIQSDSAVRQSMVQLLDTFVEAGWTQAVQLTYRLDEIFR